jgi:hypothetical protein
MSESEPEPILVVHASERDPRTLAEVLRSEPELATEMVESARNWLRLFPPLLAAPRKRKPLRRARLNYVPLSYVPSVDLEPLPYSEPEPIPVYLIESQSSPAKKPKGRSGRPRVEVAYPDEIKTIRGIREEHQGATDEEIIDIGIARLNLTYKQVKLRLERAKP